MRTTRAINEASPRLRERIGRWMPGGALAVLGVLGAALGYGLFLTGQHWVGQHVNARAAADAAGARYRAARLERDASLFLAQMAQEPRKQSILQLRIPGGVQLHAAANDLQQFTIPAVKPGDGQACSLSVDASADLAAEVVWLHPRELTCDGQVVAVRGDIRDMSGRVLSAEVIASRGGWFAEPIFSLRLLPNTAAQAWLQI